MQLLLLGPSAAPLAELAAALRPHDGLSITWATQPSELDQLLTPNTQVGAAQRRVFLLGLAQATAAERQTDQALRETLQAHGRPYQVIYPNPTPLVRAEAMGSMLDYLKPLCQALFLQAPPQRRMRPRGDCAKCSDPDCEHRLFQDLLSSRPSVSGTN